MFLFPFFEIFGFFKKKKIPKHTHICKNLPYLVHRTYLAYRTLHPNIFSMIFVSFLFLNIYQLKLRDFFFYNITTVKVQSDIITVLKSLETIE